nr:gluconokinase [Hyphomonas sp. Mor2]
MAPPIMIMGIMASGKSRIGEQLAQQLGGVFIEGDDWHPASNVEKMRAGIPLTDEDRAPWLGRLADEIIRASETGQRVVFSCSALKQTYRNQLRASLPGLMTICLTVDAKTAAHRSGSRASHFMPAGLVESQLATLELPQNEARTELLDATQDFERVFEQVQRAIERLKSDEVS